MSAINNILELIKQLTEKERADLKACLLDGVATTTKLEDFITSERFASGRACPICGSIHVVRNGRRADGTQRYLCRDCGKSFVAMTNSIVASTKKGFTVWEKYINCMMNGMSLRKTLRFVVFIAIQRSIGVIRFLMLFKTWLTALA